MDVSKQDIVWTAGFLDGEGYIGIIRGKQYAGRHHRKYKARERCSFKVQVSAAQVDRRPLDKLANLWGGRVGLYQHADNRRSACHQWMLSKVADVERLLKAIEPFLVVKGENARTCLEFRKFMGPRTATGRTPRTPQDEAYMMSLAQATRRRH